MLELRYFTRVRLFACFFLNTLNKIKHFIVLNSDKFFVSPLGIARRSRLSLLMFHLCYLDVYFSLLAPLRTSEWMACECSTNSWGYGVVLISCDGSRRFVPLFSRRWGNCPKVCRTFNGAHIRRLVVAKSRNM